MAGFAPRIPPIPSSITGDVRRYLEQVRAQLNSEAYISKFSAANPNTSGLSGLPGNLAVNIGSASTSSRLWIMEGSAPSLDTNAWRIVRIA
jgi:hypothetical protein